MKRSRMQQAQAYLIRHFGSAFAALGLLAYAIASIVRPTAFVPGFAWIRDMLGMTQDAWVASYIVGACLLLVIPWLEGKILIVALTAGLFTIGSAFYTVDSSISLHTALAHGLVASGMALAVFLEQWTWTRKLPANANH